jgi:hypothetical protein
MEYEAPEIDLIGPASELIQASCGPFSDGDGYVFSHGCHALDE